MMNRREFFGLAAGAGASLALTPDLLRALEQSQGQLIQRAVPSSGEMLPVIGVARGNVQDNARLRHLANMLDPSSEAYAMLRAVVKTMVDNGGRVLDSAWGGVDGQQVTSMIANELGIQNKIFWSTGLPIPGAPGQGGPPPPPDAATVKTHLEAVFARLKVPRIDLIMITAGAAPTRLGVLNEARKEGRVRYIGVDYLAAPIEANRSGSVYAPLETIMRNEQIDFIGIPHYHIGDRRAEETLLPLAQERKIGVVAYMPFSLGRLFQRAGTTPLPEWAADFDAKTWAQFFLKYLVSHPAVTVVLPGTSSATHMLDNIGGGIGRLPNEPTRKRMAEFFDALPPPPAPPPPAGQAAQAPGPQRISLVRQ